MRKENISIAYDSEKLSAVKMYMEQRDTDLKSEMENRSTRSIRNMFLLTCANILI